MAASQVNKSSAMLAATDFRLRVQSLQGGQGERRVAAATLFLEDPNHRLFVLNFKLVEGGDDVRRDFMPQRLGLLCERRLLAPCSKRGTPLGLANRPYYTGRAFWPAASQESLSPFQSDQFGGRVIHRSLLLQRAVRFHFGWLRHGLQRRRDIGRKIFSPVKPRQLRQVL